MARVYVALALPGMMDLRKWQQIPGCTPREVRIPVKRATRSGNKKPLPESSVSPPCHPIGVAFLRQQYPTSIHLL
jgi:hypothetical protein